MSQPIANINGKKVFSDKRVAAIINTRITFTDGSWCDVATGEVVNKGAGYINIGSPEESGSKKEFNQTFSARNLTVDNLFGADLNVQPYNGNEVVVKITGPETAVNDIEVKQKGDTVVIKGKESEGGNMGGVTIVSGRGSVTTRVTRVTGGSVVVGGRMVISGGDFVGGNIIVGGGGSENSPTQVTVQVPLGSSLDLSDIEGQTTVGDVLGSLTISGSVSGDFSVGRVKDTSVSISGSGDAVIKEITGNLDLDITGSGDVKVNSGQVNNLTAKVTGSGNFRFRGRAVNAKLTLTGSGDIYVAHVDNEPTMKSRGSGDIEVGNW